MIRFGSRQPIVMNGRERFLGAIELKPVDRTPVWVMRQAGRYLPEYRAMKAVYGFRGMVTQPEVASEVTIQPILRFPSLDAAILFSDILVIPEAMGMAYSFRDEGGIGMEWQFATEQDLMRLQPGSIMDRLGYVLDAAKRVKARLGGERALLGFGGSPWTLATYMVEGGSSRDFATIREMTVRDPSLLEQLLERITEATISYFRALVAAGVDAIQVFDSWGSACPDGTYEKWSIRWIRDIISEVGNDVPVILFSKGMSAYREEWKSTGARVFSLDSSVSLRMWAEADPGRAYAVQGNLDPELLNGDPESVVAETRKVLGSVGSLRGHIFNLGHGILPDANIECVEAMLDTIVEQSTADQAG